MKIYEEKTVPARVDKICTMIVCDLCETEGRYGWEESCYDVDETEVTVSVKHKEGSSFPEGTDIEVFCVDLCPDCFKKKLVPWLQTQNPNLKYEEQNW